MYRLARGTTIAATLAAALVVSVVGPAAAEDGQAPAAEVTADVAAVTAAVEEATSVVDDAAATEVGVTVAGDGDAAAVAETEAGTVVIPETSAGEISIGEGATEVEIGLPEGIEGAGVRDASGETVVYSEADQPADLAVQATEEGARALVTIKDASAPHRYAFDVAGPEGSRLVPAVELLGAEADSGEVLLLDADGALLGSFDAPWAIDANGQPVPTHYELEGNALVQVVDFTADTAFPVVADPNWWAVAKCAAAIVAFVGMNLVVASKLIKVKKLIGELGGFREAASLMLRAANWEERLRIGGNTLVALASEILGFAVIRNNCR